MIQDMQKNFEIKKIKRSAFKAKKVHSHPFHELFYLARGECTAFISHNIYKFHHGYIVIAPAGTIHKTDYTGKGMHERIVISFKPTVTEWLNNVVGTDIVSDVMQAGVISIPEKRRDYIESLL